MTAGTYDITIEQGATFSRVLTYRDSTDALINLTGYTARLQMRESVDSTTTFISLTTENGGITLGGALGTITLAITATASAAITVSQGVYDLELINGATITRLVEGSVIINKEVTR